MESEQKEYEILSAEAFTCKTWNADCPYCGNMGELGTDSDKVAEGDEFTCMECEKVFRIGSKRDLS